MKNFGFFVRNRSTAIIKGSNLLILLHMNIQIISKVAIVGVLFFGSALSVFAANESEVNCAVIARNLRVGMSGSDVKVLQEVLNRNTETRLAQAGPGSPGSETMYFGQITKAAVTKFQEIYKDEVLTPVGLVSGSGYVGVFTRAKILTLCNKPQSLATPLSPTPTVVTSPSSPTVNSLPVKTVETITTTTVATVEVPDPYATALPLPPQVSSQSPYTGDGTIPVITDLSGTGAPVLMYPSSYVVKIESVLSVYGINFAAVGNTVHIGSYLIKNVTSKDGSLLSVTLGKDVPLGKHDLWVSNAKGVTETSFVIITAPDTLPPVVTSFTPTEGNIGTVITITGSGFTPTDNEIHGGDKNIIGLASPDGKTLTFVIPINVPGYDANNLPPPQNVRMPVWFYVVNANGVSNASVFTLAV